jgi:putative ABC transport system permease protein
VIDRPARDARATVRWPRSRLHGAPLLLRLRRPVRGPSFVVAVLVLAVAAMIAATPSVFTAMTASEMDQTIRQAPPISHTLISRPAGEIVTLPSNDPSTSGLSPELDNVFGLWQDQLDTLYDDLPAEVRAVAGPARWSMTGSPVAVGPTPRSTPASSATSVVPRVDVQASSVARLVAGQWPQSADFLAPAGIVISQQTASVLHLSVGATLGQLRVAGIFRPVDPDADYWALNPGMLQPNIFDDGNLPITITATAFVDPLRWNTVPQTAAGLPNWLIWFPLDLSRMPGTQSAALLAGLRGAVARPYQLPTHEPSGQGPRTIQSLALTADVIPALEAALGRVNGARSVLTVAAIGPLAAAIAVLVLAVRALERRRRPLAGLLATRGVPSGRLRLLLAADGLITGLPAAVVAVAALWWWFGADAAPSGLLLGLLAGLVPAGLLGGTRIEAAMRPARADVGIRSASRYRWVAELAVLALAGVSLYLLLSAGLQTAPSAGTDLLVAAAPLLLAAAACVLVLRLYPLPLRLLAGMFRRRRGAVGFVGSARALRDPVVGIAPVLAVVAGVSVAVFSAVTLSTLSQGTNQAALTDLGAPMRVTGVGVTAAQYDRIQRVPGVTAAARTMLVGSMAIQVGDQPTRPAADVYLADTAALARVQLEVPGAVRIPVGMTGGPTPGAVVSTGLAGPGTELRMGPAHPTVMGTAGGLPGLGRSPDFVLLDSSVTAYGPFRPDAVLIAIAPGADTASVRTALTAILGPDVQIRLADDAAAALRTGAIVTGMRVALIASLAAAGIAAVAALLLTMVLTTAARARLLAILRILGLSMRQRRWLVVWEQTPAAVMALVVGSALGLGLSALVRTAVDLTPFTGGRVQPDWYVNPGLLALLLGGFVLLVAAATWFGVLMTRRVTAATAIKLDEE